MNNINEELATALLLSLMIFLYNWASGYEEEKKIKSSSINIEINDGEDASVIKNRLVSKVDSYIKRKSHGETTVKASTVVEACLKYNVPIQLCLAQGTFESHWGTEGRAKRSNSVFCVGAYDDGRDVCCYKDLNASIEPFVKMVSNDYLLNGEKSIDELLVNYVNYKGHRYSSNKDYEKTIAALISEIDVEIMDDFSKL